MDLGLVVSSLLLTYLFWRERRLTWAVLFALNLLMWPGHLHPGLGANQSAHPSCLPLTSTGYSCIFGA